MEYNNTSFTDKKLVCSEQYICINSNSENCNNSINKLKIKLNELNNKLEFCNKYMVNINQDNTIKETIESLENVINKINNKIINNGQFNNKVKNKNIEFEF